MFPLAAPSPVAIASAFAFVLALALAVWGLFQLLRPGGPLRTGLGLAGVTVGAVVLLFAGAGIAWAGEPTVYAVTLPKDLLATLLDYILVALLAGLMWLGRRAAAWLHLDREGKLVQRFDAGAEAALAYAREVALARLTGTGGLDFADPQARAALVKDAAAYLLPKIPGTLRELGIDPDGLRERLTARLDLVAPHPGADVVAAGPRGA